MSKLKTFDFSQLYQRHLSETSRRDLFQESSISTFPMTFTIPHCLGSVGFCFSTILLRCNIPYQGGAYIHVPFAVSNIYFIFVKIECNKK